MESEEYLPEFNIQILKTNSSAPIENFFFKCVKKIILVMTGAYGNEHTNSVYTYTEFFNKGTQTF